MLKCYEQNMDNGMQVSKSLRANTEMQGTQIDSTKQPSTILLDNIG